MRNFKKYLVWEKAHTLTLDIYKITNKYPPNEMYGLINQMRRSASSIPTNIAEGCGRYTDIEFARFVAIASGSACELEYQIILSKDLAYVNDIEFNDMNTKINEIKKMLSSLHKKLLANG